MARIRGALIVLIDPRAQSRYQNLHLILTLTRGVCQLLTLQRQKPQTELASILPEYQSDVLAILTPGAKPLPGLAPGLPSYEDGVPAINTTAA